MKAEDAARIAESAAQCALLRCLFGNPFHAAPAAQRSWLTWNDGTVKKLAESFYEEHAFDHLPILADALEEAGCADADMLAHLRGPGPHARGCAALDAVLGKE